MKNKKLRPIFKGVFILVVGAVLGLNIYNWNANRLTGDALPMPFGYGAAVVLSGSMEPTIGMDELIVVRAEESYAVGDVVVYQDRTLPVVHRIVAVEGESVTTRGDANNVNDEPIQRSQIKGRVIAHIPYVGAVLRLLKTPVATILLIVVAVLCVELPYQREKDKKQEELNRIKEEIRRLKEEQQG